ncbi:hypothetical protein BDZ90DRAFT_263148 [Jaminaea rosea]|uniref:Uncharacterized protein n=1 Tax=Jaminaea rosea TaxID=1569628 RepID=A0A316UI65_9BASI|nr:hypothetical protein BDZ90DRAFT_263148 [Jaminaea rosea]PWN24604.1 hypothetical protein BDZ90DRAFT_263148 [Jaminaea rosea]
MSEQTAIVGREEIIDMVNHAFRTCRSSLLMASIMRAASEQPWPEVPALDDDWRGLLVAHAYRIAVLDHDIKAWAGCMEWVMPEPGEDEPKDMDDLEHFFNLILSATELLGRVVDSGREMLSKLSEAKRQAEERGECRATWTRPCVNSSPFTSDHTQHLDPPSLSSSTYVVPIQRSSEAPLETRGELNVKAGLSSADSMVPFFHAHKPTKEVVDAAVNDLAPLLQEAEDAVDFAEETWSRPCARQQLSLALELPSYVTTGAPSCFVMPTASPP